jgi:hypothetical protein
MIYLVYVISKSLGTNLNFLIIGVQGTLIGAIENLAIKLFFKKN